jgi:uncharacterized protein (DUF488 family)
VNKYWKFLPHRQYAAYQLQNQYRMLFRNLVFPSSDSDTKHRNTGCSQIIFTILLAN